MSLSSSSDSDGDEVRETLNRILAKSGTSPIGVLNDSDSDSESSGSDIQSWFHQIQQKFSMTSAGADPFPVIKPLSTRGPSDSDDEDVVEMMASIHRRFKQYQSDTMKEQSQFLLDETDVADTDVMSGQEITDILSKDPKSTNQLPDPGFTEVHQKLDGSCDVSMKSLMYSQFPKSAQNFADALKKNRSCQRFIRRKLIEIEAKIEENKKLKERIKCLMDFQLCCKRKMGHILCQKRDPRVTLISMRKLSISKRIKVQPRKKVLASYYGPAENSHVPKYKMVMKRFPVSFSKQPWSNIDKENLAKGLKQQYQEMLLLNSMNYESDLESSMNPDLMSAILSNDFEVTPEKIRSFLPLVNWDRLASMYLTGRSGSECESRWLNCEDPLINHSPWSILEDKKLLFIVQERGIYNWIDIAITLGTQRTPFQCLARYQRSLNPHILNKDWTEDEDSRLREAVEVFGDNDWQPVASYLEGRTGPQCSNRWRKTLHPDRTKVGRWSVDEDKRLKVAVMLFGAKNWNKIAQFVPGRTQVQCRERWLNCLDPSLKLDAWTEEEDRKLKAAVEEHGYSWSKVAACVPQRTDNQCMRRWKRLFPEEVLLLREARQMKKTVLISNFVDRESERPSIGPSDFSSLVNLPISDCGNSRMAKKSGAREENQREASREKKIKKPRAKLRRVSEEHLAESGSLCSSETPFTDLSLVPAEPGVSTNTAKNGSSKRRRKRVSREGPQSKIRKTVSRYKRKKSINKSGNSFEENVAVLDMVNISSLIALAELHMEPVENSYNPDHGTIWRTRNETPSHNQPYTYGPEFIQSIETVPAYSMGNSSEADPSGFSVVPGINTGEQGSACETIQGTSRPSRTSTAKDRRHIKETGITDFEVNVCADEDVPLISWLDSLALEARSKRLTNTPSRRPGAINQKETCCGDTESIHIEKPRGKRKRCRKEPRKNCLTGCGDNTLSKDKNNKSCYLVAKQKGISNQPGKGNNTVQLGHIMVDDTDASAPISDGPPTTEDVPACVSSSTNEISYAVTSKAATDDSLLGFMLQNKTKRKRQCLDGKAAA